jgi:hypothetical protein
VAEAASSIVRPRTFPDPAAVSSLLQRSHVGRKRDGLAVIDDTTLLYAHLRCYTLFAVSSKFPKIPIVDRSLSSYSPVAQAAQVVVGMTDRHSVLDLRSEQVRRLNRDLRPATFDSRLQSPFSARRRRSARRSEPQG